MHRKPSAEAASTAAAAAASARGAAEDEHGHATWHARVMSVVSFALVSFVIVFTNKFVLSVYGFPSVKFLALVQCCASCVIMAFQKNVLGGLLGVAKYRDLYPAPSLDVVRRVMPLPVLFFFNMVSGLSATKSLNIPMFVLLRRFSIAMTLALEFYWLGHGTTRMIVGSVAIMLLGALVAAADDVTVDAASVFYILVNDLFTALQGVMIKAKLSPSSHSHSQALAHAPPARSPAIGDGAGFDDAPSSSDINTSSPSDSAGSAASAAPMTADAVQFYNSLLASVPALLLWVSVPAEVHAVTSFSGWAKPGFVAWFTASMLLGFALNYTYFWCTKANSALTSTVVGSAKNCISSYVGMLMGDYRFTPLNFLGVNISLFAAILYTFGEVRKQQVPKKAVETKV